MKICEQKILLAHSLQPKEIDVIKFVSVSIRNFMSIGDVPLVFDFKSGISFVVGKNYDVSDQNDNNLISNGSGKTVVLVDSLLFALYGKTQRKIKKSEIVNVYNGGNCEVKLTFEKDGVVYLIERGLNPDYLLIYKNGIAESEEAKKRQANKIIEEELLDGISFEVFKNLIVMNGSTSRHFFEYGKQEKRDFINQVFRLGFVEFLQEELTDDYKNKKIETEKLEVKESLKKEELIRLRELCTNPSQSRSESIKKLQDQLSQQKNEVTNIQKQLSEYSTEFGSFSALNTKRQETKELIRQLDARINSLTSKISTTDDAITRLRSEYVITKNEKQCPTCKQDIPTERREQIIASLTQNGKSLSIKLTEIKEEYKKLSKERDDLNVWVARADDVILKAKVLKNNEVQKTLYMEECSRQLSSIQSQQPPDPKTLAGMIEQTNKEIDDITKELSSSRYELVLLKTTRDIVGGNNFYGHYMGVFRSYLNKAINEYLEKMNSPHRIIFNHDLDADVFDGNKKVHSYDNLSTGEKAKVNISLLLSFFDVLYSFHRLQTSLLVLDEVIDVGIDGTGVELLHKILWDKTKTNPDVGIYVITHKTESFTMDQDGVSKVIIEKRNGFTVLGDS
jgi:DNA repair exonuclease SbcCD ATPase subunit